jgi:predicted transcriptional regulator
MKRNTKNSTFTSLYLRATWDLDRLVEEMARSERRTKAAVITLALEQYATTHHPDLFAKYEEEAT